MKGKKRKQHNNNQWDEWHKGNDPLHNHDCSSVTLNEVANAVTDDTVNIVNSAQNNADNNEYFDDNDLVEDENEMDNNNSEWKICGCIQWRGDKYSWMLKI